MKTNKDMRNFKCILVALLTIMFCACSSDDNNLEGTTWTTIKKQNEYNEEWEITFEEKQYHLYYHSYTENTHIGAVEKVLEAVGSYSKEGDIILINWVDHATDGTYVDITMQGTINGNTMYFPKLGEFEELVLHKK